MSTQPEAQLRHQARERIRDGRLPGMPQPRVWGGPGSEQPCALCDAIIRRDEVEYELEEPRPDGVTFYRFHFNCHAIWAALINTACAAPAPADPDEG